jgi:hypothetical protein
MLKSSPGAAGTADVNDFGQVVADPAAFYATPAAIVDDAGLTRQQRLQLLGEWAQDLVDRQVAENEGMAPETAGAGARETSLLRLVNAAMEQVEASPETPPNLLTRAWRRLVAG